MSGEIPVPHETLRWQEQMRALIPDEAWKPIRDAVAARDVDRLAEMANGCLIAEALAQANEAAVKVWQRATIEALLNEGLELEQVGRILDFIFAALAELHGSAELDGRDTTPVLPDSRGTAYSTRGLRKLIGQATAAAKIAKPVSPHWLRHSHATLAALGGASAFAIKASLGHARLETSERYVHWAKGLAETTVDSLPAFDG